jgi:hypothetical protein
LIPSRYRSAPAIGFGAPIMLLIDAIAIVESGGKNVPGDHGAALSIFQIHEAAWADVRKRFGIHQDPIDLDVGTHFTDISGDDLTSRFRARNCATGYVFILEERLKRAGQEASPENVYACWNLGFDGFKHRHFMLARCPKITFQKARRVGQLIHEEHPAPQLLHD